VTVLASLLPVPVTGTELVGTAEAEAGNAVDVADEDDSLMMVQLPRPFRPYHSNLSSLGHLRANL